MWKLVAAALGRHSARWPEPEPPNERLRGRVEIDFERCTLSGACAEACPTPALRLEKDAGAARAKLALDLGQCVFCGLCEEACSEGAIRLGGFFEMAARRREDLWSTGSYGRAASETLEAPGAAAVEVEGQALRERLIARLGRSLQVRVIDAGDCGGCLAEAAAIAGPIHDMTRFGIEFVSSPRHADLLLVTGTITPALVGPLLEAREAMAEPRLVVAVGACAIGGGIYHSGAGESQSAAKGPPPELPIDVWVPGCPPRPQALLHALRLAVGAAEPKQRAVHWRGDWPA